MYCGNPTGRVRKGEHLIPDAIGGTIATKDVCPRCNNVLSDIDRELCSRSPLSFVAAKEIDGHIWQAWDVDEKSGMLLDGRPDFERSSFKLYPQIIIVPGGEQFWADYEELRGFGVDRFHVLFARRLRKAFWEYQHGNKKAIQFVHISHNDGLLTNYRYPPRFFVRGSILEACTDKTIELGYVGRCAQRFALSRVESGLNLRPLERAEIAIGSALPTVRCFCDGGKVWRALAKIAINLLHRYCSKTPVNCQTFSRVIAEIMGARPFNPNRLDGSGFVRATDVATFAADKKSHTFRLSWEKGWWNAAMAFFGGQIGAAVKFPGPNNEQWCTLDIRAPINSTAWTVSKSSLLIPARFNVEWFDLNKMIPDGGFVDREKA